MIQQHLMIEELNRYANDSFMLGSILFDTRDKKKRSLMVIGIYHYFILFVTEFGYNVCYRNIEALQYLRPLNGEFTYKDYETEEEDDEWEPI